MHPNRVFEWTDEAEMLSFVSHRAFAHVFTGSETGLFVVHVPVLVTDDGRIQFHVARRNRIATHLAGGPVLISVAARDGYQSANWYVSANQVPTWHYESVEVQGHARELAADELVAQLDQLSLREESRHSPERPWTRAKMEPGAFEAMTRAIAGFEVEPAAIRGTRKFNQHKSPEDIAATIQGQQGAGRTDLAAAIREAAERR